MREKRKRPKRRTNGADAGVLGPKLLRRTEKTSVILGVVLAIPAATYWGVGAGAGWLAGIAWSLINLRFIASITEKVFAQSEREHKKIVLAVAIKFPVLYLVGFLLLRSEFIPALWLIAGFTWPFFVLFMKGAGRAYLQLDQTSSDD